MVADDAMSTISPPYWPTPPLQDHDPGGTGSENRAERTSKETWGASVLLLLVTVLETATARQVVPTVRNLRGMKASRRHPANLIPPPVVVLTDAVAKPDPRCYPWVVL